MEIYIMKRTALYLLMSLATIQVNAAQLTITFDVNLNLYWDPYGALQPHDFNTQYSLHLDTDQFVYNTATNQANVNNGNWSFNPKPDHITNTDSPGALIFQAAMYPDSYNIWFSGEKNSPTTEEFEWLNPAYGEFRRTTSRVEEYNNIIMHSSLTTPQNIEELLLSLNTMMINQELFVVNHSTTEWITEEICDFARCRSYSDYIEHSYRGSASISNIYYENAVVPAPAAAWLMGSGLLGLTAAARRKKV